MADRNCGWFVDNIGKKEENSSKSPLSLTDLI